MQRMEEEVLVRFGSSVEMEWRFSVEVASRSYPSL